MKHFFIAVVFSMTLLGVCTPLSAQNWLGYISEESPNNESICPSGINGMKCHGRYCDNISISCSDGDSVNVFDGGNWMTRFSEESPNNNFSCSKNTIATGLQCNGGYCDNLTVRCDPIQEVTVNCRQTNSISEERPNNEAFFENAYLTGIQCRGSNCDNKILTYCDLEPRDDVGDAYVGWELACAGGQGCDLVFEESLDIGNQTEQSWTKTKATQVSTSVKAEYGVSTALKFTGEAKRVVTKTNERAAAIVRTKDRGYSQSCGHSIDMIEYDIHAVWQWVIKVPVADTEVKISSCQITCTPEMQPPNYAPGSNEDIGSCRTVRAATIDNAPESQGDLPAIDGVSSVPSASMKPNDD